MKPSPQMEGPCGRLRYAAGLDFRSRSRKSATMTLADADSLATVLRKPRAEWSVDDLVESFADQRIRLVSLMHVGGDGWIKALDFVPRDTAHLRDILESGDRADGSSLFAGLGIPTTASDIVLRPRMQSAFLDPFATVPTLCLMCGHCGRDGTPLPQSPDTIVRRASAAVNGSLGCELHALGEIEFFLGKRRDERDIYGADDRGYHATAPFVFGEDLRRHALVLLSGMGIPVKYGHSEVGYIEAKDAGGLIWEQHEIELALQPLPQAADAIALTQWVLRNLAHQRGMQCSTAPMMAAGHAGNGLHFHLAPVAREGPVPVRTPDGSLSEPARWLIGGLVRLGGALMAFGNRQPGSFSRLAQGKEAPTSIVWGEYDRSALIRLPIVPAAENGSPHPETVEFRLPDGSALPHLLLAGAALAMIHGREVRDLSDLLQRTRAGRESGGRYGIERVPTGADEVAEALARWRGALETGEVFPPGMLDAVVAGLKRAARHGS